MLFSWYSFLKLNSAINIQQELYISFSGMKKLEFSVSMLTIGEGDGNFSNFLSFFISDKEEFHQSLKITRLHQRGYFFNSAYVNHAVTAGFILYIDFKSFVKHCISNFTYGSF